MAIPEYARQARFVFCGNRAYVLNLMLARGLDVDEIFAVPGSWLERDLIARRIPFRLLPAKREFVTVLASMTFDVFVANGCPRILPVSALARDGERRFVNVHPSGLPDLRGADPVPGALLYGRGAGATVHLMDDGIDTGPVIAQVLISMTDDLDCGLLYQLSFMAEQEAFGKALARGFMAAECQPVPLADALYYTIRPEHLRIDFAEDAEAIRRRILAFGTRSRGAWFEHDGGRFLVPDAEVVRTPFLVNRLPHYRDKEIVMIYEGNVLIRRGGAFLKLKSIQGDLSRLRPGTILT